MMRLYFPRAVALAATEFWPMVEADPAMSDLLSWKLGGGRAAEALRACWLGSVCGVWGAKVGALIGGSTGNPVTGSTWGSFCTTCVGLGGLGSGGWVVGFVSSGFLTSCLGCSF